MLRSYTEKTVVGKLDLKISVPFLIEEKQKQQQKW